MRYCPECGRELDDEVLFCKYCGVKLEKDESEELNTEEKKQDLEALSLELRKLCDRMTACYVDASVQLEQARASQQAEVQRLGEELRVLKEDLQRTKEKNAELEERLRQSEEANARLQAEKKELEGRLQQAEALIPDGESEADGWTGYCPGCGAPVEESSLFCGNCGLRLKNS